ncbi:hypothetical protein B0T25DRAFT_220904 [Lasiosphaeria hispida]|uniref:C2H2-type domain-containing protein n=1 Tax=Lasiosphaeria hispida TaxID=260671 RepID=A0AAJ0HJJ5_9PEZI|nr:hypothetical protein B0T25DRAFT_220904 [Lasiosphaeria hispida]
MASYSYSQSTARGVPLSTTTTCTITFKTAQGGNHETSSSTVYVRHPHTPAAFQIVVEVVSQDEPGDSANKLRVPIRNSQTLHLVPMVPAVDPCHSCAATSTIHNTKSPVSSSVALCNEWPCGTSTSGESIGCDTPSWESESGSNDYDDDDDENWIFTDPKPEHPTLEAGHELNHFIDELAEVGIEGARLQYVQHQDLPKRKRKGDDGLPPCRAAKRRRSSAASNTARDRRRGDAAAGGDAVQNVPFQCPFFAQNPASHLRCLHHNLRRIIDVKRHIWTDHRQPQHCPICRTVFDRAGEWDIHIRNGQCERSAAPPIGGASEDQLDKLSWPSDPKQDEDEQWFTIWEIVFPRVSRPPQSRLVDDLPFVWSVRLLRDYWDTQGHGKLREFLDEKTKTSNEARGDKRSLEALHASVLIVMIDRIVSSLDADRIRDSELLGPVEEGIVGT